MNRFLFLAALLLLVSAPLLHADGLTDPHTGIDDPSCNTQTGCPIAWILPVSVAQGTSFMFNANGSGGGISFFQTAPGLTPYEIGPSNPLLPPRISYIPGSEKDATAMCSYAHPRSWAG